MQSHNRFGHLYHSIHWPEEQLDIAPRAPYDLMQRYCNKPMKEALR